MRFYICEHCGNIVTFVKSSGVPVMCCGQKMTELVPGTTDAAVEHPMIPEHFIEWIALETREGVQIKHLTPGSKPQAVFALAQGDSVVSAYAYCNLHGLWKA